jgi:mannitol/fructose-specific phosphotransferase system IIA component (Ntr-type)
VIVASQTDTISEPDAVLPDLRAVTGEEAVKALHAALVAVDGVTDAAEFLAGLLERMRFAPVCIAEDIALPHVRTDAVNRLVVAVGRVAEGVVFDPQHPKVHLVFLIGVPKDAVTEYLRVVAVLSRRLRIPGTIASLMAASNETDFRALLAGRAAAPR